MREFTDKERMDFLQNGKYTRWIGYNTTNGHFIHPVFAGMDLRAAIDKLMRSCSRPLSQSYEDVR